MSRAILAIQEPAPVGGPLVRYPRPNAQSTNLKTLPKPLCLFLISNADGNSLDSNWRIVYLCDGVHQDDVSLFAGSV
jgi:hypothetical protein